MRGLVLPSVAILELPPCDCLVNCADDARIHLGTARSCSDRLRFRNQLDQSNHIDNQRIRFIEHFMETFTQPTITGYRQLSEEEPELMNEIKQHGVQLGELVDKLKATASLDQRWVAIGATDLQTGLMALTRGVAQPTTF